MTRLSLNSTVLYQNTLYQVRDRTRNKTTHLITLWLCTCSGTQCQHTKIPAPLEEVTRLPQKGDRICDYKTRLPYTVTGYKLMSDRCLIQVQGIELKTRILQLNQIDPLPEVGDRVIVAAKPYCEWVRAKAKPLRGHDQQPSWAHRELIDNLDDLSWITHVFEVRAIKEKSAICIGDGVMKELPVQCLRVLEKGKQIEKSLAA